MMMNGFTEIGSAVQNQVQWEMSPNCQQKINVVLNQYDTILV